MTTAILWTNNRLKTLKKLYATTDNETLSKMLGIPVDKLNWRAKYEGLKKSRAKLTHEERSESARRAWVTRRANGNVPKPKPPKPKPPKRLLTPEERKEARARAWETRHKIGRQKPRMQRCTCRHINSAKMR